MQGFILTAIAAAESVERKLKVKGTGSRFLLQECVKEIYYARFHPHS